MKVLIDFVDSATQADIDAFLAENNCTFIKKFASFGNIYLVESPDSELTESDLVEEVKTQVDSDITLLATNDITDSLEIRPFTVDNDNWWKAASYWDTGYSMGDTVDAPVNPLQFNVYLMDSGIDKSHPDFVGQTISELFSVTGEFSDTRGHGTALASLITGNTCAMSQANLFDVKIVKPGATTSQLELLEALDTIQTHFMSQDPMMPAVINMSWAIPHDPYINYKIEQMMANNIMVVAAAGNSGVPISDVTPASIPNVFTIGAYNENFEPADFSNYTSAISNTAQATNTGVLDYWAPGTDILVANLTGGYSLASGTSMAAAIVTGCVVYNMSVRYQTFNQALVEDEYWNATLIPNSDSIPGFINHRSDILDLPAGYDQSTNKIVTFNINGNPTMGDIWYDLYKGVDQTLSRGFLGGTVNGIFVYDVEDVETVELVSGSLPTGMRWIHGFAIHDAYSGPYSETPPPVADFESVWRFTSYDGTQTVLTLDFQMLDPDYELPEDRNHPDYNIVLLAFCGDLAPICNIDDVCPPGTYCSPIKSTGQCDCLPL